MCHLLIENDYIWVALIPKLIVQSAVSHLMSVFKVRARLLSVIVNGSVYQKDNKYESCSKVRQIGSQCQGLEVNKHTITLKDLT